MLVIAIASLHSSSISPLISCERAIRERHRRFGRKLLIAFELAVGERLRTAFSISRWALTPSVLRNFRILALKTSSFMLVSFAPLYPQVL
jgi:hypothetical protein